MSESEPVRADFDLPSIARIYDYHLGGSANFAVDRDAGDELERIYPDQLAYCRYNRGFLWRAVRTLAVEYGIDQFLDLGSGVPTVGNVHEAAQRCHSRARVAYVDWEAIAVAHAQHLLTEQPRVTVTQADVAEPERVLASPGVAELLDFSRPVAVLALGILDITSPAIGAAALMAAYRDACCPGSALAVSNGAQLTASDEQVAQINALMAKSSTPRVHWRSREQVAELLPGYKLLDPGVVPTAAWRPEQSIGAFEADRSNAYAAVGMLR